jgi:hypothetical protein
MKMKIFYLISIVLIITIQSCNTCKYVAKHPECFPADTIIEKDSMIVKDSIYIIQQDSSVLEMYFKCDSNNQVLIQKVNSTQGVKTKTKYIFKDNFLKVNAYNDSIVVLNRIIERYKNNKTVTRNPINEKLKRENEKLEKKIKNRRVFIWFSITIIILIIVFLFIKFAVKFIF